MGVARLKLVEWRNDFPDSVEAVSDPRLLDCFSEKVKPDAKASGKCLSLIACIGVDNVVIR